MSYELNISLGKSKSILIKLTKDSGKKKLN